MTKKKAEKVIIGLEGTKNKQQGQCWGIRRCRALRPRDKNFQIGDEEIPNIVFRTRRIILNSINHHLSTQSDN